jgi:hypothetical protein
MPRWHAVVAAVSVGVALLAVLAAFEFLPRPGRNSSPNLLECGATNGPALSSVNLTAALPRAFVNGSIQAFGSNASSVMFGGVSFYERNHLPFDSLPALGSFSPATATTQDLSSQANPYFAEGGVFPVGWNGSEWLIAGQATIGNVTVGSAISLQGGRITNLTPLVAPFFQGEGIWIAGWDGEGWLLGGNNTQGAALVYLRGESVTNLTPLLPNNGPGKWIQALAWNGSGWLVGGQGVFGAYEDGRFADLLPGSPFRTGGVLAMDWNGSTWLVGGSPSALAYVHGTNLRAAPSPTSNSAGWVNSIVAAPGSAWIVSGGTYSNGRYAPFLTAVTSNATTAQAVDESACLPGAFQGGWVQYGAWAPAFGLHDIVLGGEGGTNPSTFKSHSAAAVLVVGG